MWDTLIHFRDTFNDHVVFSVGILLIIGYFAGKLAEKIRLPAITGYLFTGLLLGDSVTGIIHTEMTETLRTITDVALGIIAVTIGSEFGLRKLKRLGRGIVIITVIQILFTFAAVSLALYLFHLPLISALLLGAIASATAPAATVIIIHSLKARGDFVDTLYGVVALDDMGCVILFAGVFSFATGMMGAETHSFMTSMGHASGEILFSLGLGVMEGVLLHLLTRKTKRENEMLIITLGVIFIFTAVSLSLHLSLLLCNMAAGAIVINISHRRNKMFRVIKPITPPLYAAFFAIAGTEIDLKVLLNPWILGIGSVYILARAAGKYSGVWVGTKVAGISPRVGKYLGLCMLPQAGVAIGLILLINASPALLHASSEIKANIAILTNIVLFGVAINELVGPPLSKFAIIRGADL